MTAHEKQDEGVVLIGFILNAGRRRQLAGLHGRCSFPATAGQLAAKVVGHAPGGDLNQPAARIAGNAFPRPLNSRGEKGLLYGILRERGIAQDAECQPIRDAAVAVVELGERKAALRGRDQCKERLVR